MQPMSVPSRLIMVVFFIAFLLLGPGNSFHIAQGKSRGFRLNMSTAVVDGSATSIHSTLKKPSKVLTVGVDYAGSGLTATELSILSMQLRKCKVSAIWCQDIESIKEFASEQESARGNFPGPCPVIYHGSAEHAASALSAGASAVVTSAESLDKEQWAEGEIIWKVASQKEVELVLERTHGRANVFLVETGEDDMAAVVESIPTSALWIAAVEPMQADGAEVTKGKSYKSLGCGSILVRKACVGDAEDLEYAQFLVSGLTSKASSEFKFSGLTGSTNGHFGGVQANSSVNWRRPTL